MGNNFSHLAIVVNENHSFFAEFPDMTTAYKLPRVKTDEVIHRWKSDPLTFYQNQLNFAIYAPPRLAAWAGTCSTTRISTSRLYLTFTCILRREKILYDMVVPIPGDDVFDALNNRYDNRKFVDTCRLFGVDQRGSFKQQRDTTSNGLGAAYYTTLANENICPSLNSISYRSQATITTLAIYTRTVNTRDPPSWVLDGRTHPKDRGTVVQSR